AVVAKDHADGKSLDLSLKTPLIGEEPAKTRGIDMCRSSSGDTPCDVDSLSGEGAEGEIAGACGEEIPKKTQSGDRGLAALAQCGLGDRHIRIGCRLEIDARGDATRLAIKSMKAS